MLYTYFLLLILLLNLILALVVLFKNPKGSINLTFFMFVLSMVGWMIVNYLSNQFEDYGRAFIFNKMIFLVSPYISYSLVLFSLVFPFESSKLKIKNILLLVIPIAVSNILTVFDITITGITFKPGEPTGVIFGPGIYYFGLQFIAYLFIALGLLFSKYKRSSSFQKLQMQYFIFGILILTVFGTITNLVIPLLFNNFNISNYGPLLSLFIFGFTAYAILKHNLMNIKVIGTQFLVVVLSLIMLAKLFISQSTGEFLVDLFVFVLVIIFGFLLIRSVLSEVRQKEALEILTQKLRALDKQKDEFLSMAAHELRAPMTAIKGYISMVMEGDTGDIPEKARGYLADTSNITDRLIRLVNNMLNVSRIEEGRMTFQSETEHLAVPVRTVFNQFVPEAERKGLKYYLEIPNELKDKVLIDPDRIQEVVGNFISNAVKYTDRGFINVKMLQPNDKTVRVEVVDSGPGISKDEQTKLFQKFERVESNVGKTTGSGLGLYISKLLVEKFNGKIGIESDQGKGSTFWFELPLVE